MEFETLKRNYLKRNITIGVAVVLIISAVVLTFTRAKYRVTQSIPLVNGTINYSPFDIKVSTKLLVGEEEYLELDTIPTSSNISLMSSTCTNDAILTWNSEQSRYEIANLTKKGTKCEAIYAVNNSEASQEFKYTGNIQEFVALESGNYRLELWGASGGNINGYTGGKGAYTSGDIYLNEEEILYVVVGSNGKNSLTGGYNGGSSLSSSQLNLGASGGGATDIRTVKPSNNSWNEFNSLKSRIMVAAGGGGANYRGEGFGEGNGGSGGILEGINGTSVNNGNNYGYGIGTGGTQTEGGQTYWTNTGGDYQTGYYSTGTFGSSGFITTILTQSGGGGGYYGGGSSAHGGAGGGSSFVSGCAGCNAISEESTSANIVHTNQSEHYSGYVFSNIIMKSGDESITLPDGSISKGNSGNGYAKITLLDLHAYQPNFSKEVSKNGRSITVTVTPDKTNLFAINKYYYKIDDEFIESDNNTYTFENLDIANYKVEVYVVDDKNLKSEVQSDTISIVDEISIDYIIANSGMGEGTPDFSKTSCENDCDEATNGLYTAEDNDGVTYYFRGTVNNNWVKFGGFYWRIIRVNGDGTLRLIYQGNASKEPVTLGKDTQLVINNENTFTFNNEVENNAYVGYMYANGVVHGLSNSSNVKNKIDEWYKNNLINYQDFIDNNAGFCGDRQPSSNQETIDGLGGTGGTPTYYAANIRLVSHKSPTFKCTDNQDLYTITNANKGNKALTYPIGLITGDELAFAGIGSGLGYNKGYYLYNGESYWSMTPSLGGSNGSASLFLEYQGNLWGNGTLGSFATNVHGIRPVINLKADTLFEPDGTGTSDNPYVVIGAE